MISPYHGAAATIVPSFLSQRKNWLAPFPQLSLPVSLASCPFVSSGISCHLLPHPYFICYISPPLPPPHLLTTCSNISDFSFFFFFWWFHWRASPYWLEESLYSLIQHSKPSMLWPQLTFLFSKTSFSLAYIYYALAKLIHWSDFMFLLIFALGQLSPIA